MVEKAILVGCQLENMDDFRFKQSMNELSSLTETANGNVIFVLTQKRKRPDPSHYIGRGKLEELGQLCIQWEADVVIFNDELTPSQLRNLTNVLQVKVIDRTQLILDIFAQRARSKEGKLQVELAQLEYLLPRLAGKGKELSRLGGGIGTRGPGETKLETDRRYIRRRIHDLKEQLDVIVKHRLRYRTRRKRNNRFRIALIGYTNAGKSTLFNRLTTEQTVEEDQLFATLDPLTRKMMLPSGYTCLVSDTVGFIEDLPTELIAAFRSTLEEVTEADLLLHIVDSSHPNYDRHEQTVQTILKELNAEKIPILTVYNKADRMMDHFFPTANGENIQICAFSPSDRQRLKEKIEEMVLEVTKPYTVSIPDHRGELIVKLKQETIVKELVYDENKSIYKCRGFCLPDHPIMGELKKYTNGDGKKNVFSARKQRKINPDH
ncbi:GTPase HflX [Fervidibacillus halotolerans]|uniref:GTPase HflX n=1 Tax=Fervidibacillus halotolerans TaxID=2980027 RepID=A0A9E8M177_9BACI|nr:GTPase HflX [Fervidibacillus halotolerans]WAA13512.1 GTPase HflX [Fervidibacillus halotolerans]